MNEKPLPLPVRIPSGSFLPQDEDTVSKGRGGQGYFFISCYTTKLNSLTVVYQSLVSSSRLQQGKGFREAFFAPDKVEDIPGGKDKAQFWTGNDFISSFYCNHCGTRG